MRKLGTILYICLSAMLFTHPWSYALAQAKKSPQEATINKLSELEQKVKFLQTQVSGLQRRVAYSTASLDCNSKKYDEFQFDTSKLVFFAFCQKIEPYLEGHRVTLHIGNPYSFHFSAVKGKLGYGKEMWEAFDKNVEVSTTEIIRAGTWHVLTVIINPSKPEEMRNLFLELSAETAAPGASR